MGATTTAHVERCDSRSGAGRTGTVWECRGYWSDDGVRRTGRIDGAKRGSEGTDLKVRVNGARVAAANTPKTALTATGIFLAIGIVTHIRMVTWNRRDA